MSCIPQLDHNAGGIIPGGLSPLSPLAISQRVQAAIDAMATHPGLPPGYWENTLKQRMPGGAGSTVTTVAQFGGGSAAPKDTRELESALRHACWRPYVHPALMAGTSAFVTRDIQGRLGVVSLDALAGATEVALDDRKATGTVSATVAAVVAGDSREVVDFTVIILGDEGGAEVVFTFHPGAPVRPSSVKTEPGLHGKRVTVTEALAMGLTTAKVV